MAGAAGDFIHTVEHTGDQGDITMDTGMDIIMDTGGDMAMDTGLVMLRANAIQTEMYILTVVRV
jgi:hypothetical protein